MSTRYGVLVCCLLLVLAGCSGLNPDQSPTRESVPDTTFPGTASSTAGTETTTPPNTAVDETTGTDGENTPKLPVNASLVFDRTNRLLGGGYEQPLVQVERASPPETITIRPRGPFGRTMGVPNATKPLDVKTGAVAFGPNVVQITLANQSAPRNVRGLLVHEYAHAMLRQEASYERSLEGTRRARRTLTEGSATYVAQQYAERYPNTWANQDAYCDIYENGATATRLDIGAYCVGARYIDDRIDDPANLSAVYENPPNTTEQVRHGYLPGEEPPLALAVNATTPRNGSVDDGIRQGELWTYVVLGTHLSDARADRAATGWGNDVRFAYTDSGTDAERESYAWVTRWDSEQDADEFAAAVAAHAENATAGSATNATFAVERIDATTVVVLVGQQAFVDETTVTERGDGTVVVRPPNATTANVTIAVSNPDDSPRAVAGQRAT